MPRSTGCGDSGAVSLDVPRTAVDKRDAAVLWLSVDHCICIAWCPAMAVSTLPNNSRLRAAPVFVYRQYAPACSMEHVAFFAESQGGRVHSLNKKARGIEGPLLKVMVLR